MGDLSQAFILLLAGFVVVFAVLIILIAVVTIYSKIITSIQNAGKKKKTENKTKKVVVMPSEPVRTEMPAPAGTDDDNGEIPGEIIAVIAAAVDAVCGEKKHRIRSVKKARASRSAWSRAGALDNTRPF